MFTLKLSVENNVYLILDIQHIFIPCEVFATNVFILGRLRYTLQSLLESVKGSTFSNSEGTRSRMS